MLKIANSLLMTMLFVILLALLIAFDSSSQELRSQMCSQCIQKLIFMAKNLSQKLIKEWKCNTRRIKECQYPKELIEKVKCCIHYDSYDMVLNQIKQCDCEQFKRTEDPKLETKKKECRQYRYHSQKCANLNIKFSKQCPQRLKDVQN
jgi:hypothetical protein